MIWPELTEKSKSLYKTEKETCSRDETWAESLTPLDSKSPYSFWKLFNTETRSSHLDCSHCLFTSSPSSCQRSISVPQPVPKLPGKLIPDTAAQPSSGVRSSPDCFNGAGVEVQRGGTLLPPALSFPHLLLWSFWVS